MKTIRILTLNLMSLGLVAGLAACGGADPVAPVIVQAQPPATTPPPATGIPLGNTCGVAGDYVQTCLIPYMQSYYGNIVLMGNVQINLAVGGVLTLPAGTYTWAQVYQTIIIPMAQGCNCIIQNVPNNGISILGQINYGALYSSIGYQNFAANTWTQVPVQLQSTAFGLVNTNFGFVFDQLISLGYQYYSAYYQSYYPNQAYYLGQWNPYYSNGFSLGGVYGNNGTGLSLGFSGSFSF